MCHKCSKCKYETPVYLKENSKLLHACGYNLIKFTRRPCPAGEQCTVYEVRRREERNPWL